MRVNGQVAVLGQQIDPTKDQITLSGEPVKTAAPVTIVLNKPVGYVTSRRGQGSKTIYDLLPAEFQQLKPAGRLDKASSGLLVLSNDGDLINQLIHPSRGKSKRYQVRLDRPLDSLGREYLEAGVVLTEGKSRLKLVKRSGADLTVELATGWNRQIRRTFEALEYGVMALQRDKIGAISLDDLATGRWRNLTDEEAAWLGSS